MKYLSALLLVFFIAACSTKLSEEEYYSKAQEMYAGQKFDLAIENFKGIAENYPQGKHHAEALFMLGFINANDIKNLDEAKKYYTEFVQKYPNHEIVRWANSRQGSESMSRPLPICHVAIHLDFGLCHSISDVSYLIRISSTCLILSIALEERK